MPGRAPRRPAAVLAAALALAVVGGCSWFGDRPVDLQVAGVDARWQDLSGVDRPTLVVTPDAEPPPGGWPLVVVLHGLGGDPEFTARLTGWAEASARHGLAVVLPEGVDSSWNAGSCCGTAAATGVDDVAVVRSVFRGARRDLPVDRSRNYLAGWSNGGMLTYRFLCSDSSLLAGAASVAGTNTAGCEPDGAVPFLQVSGTLDDVVPLDGGPSSRPLLGPFPSVRASVAGVAAAEGCGAPAVDEAGIVTRTRWAPCRDGSRVGLDVVEGMDHGWFLPDRYATTEEIVRFWGLA